jgi:cytidylate kinase
MNDMEAKKQAIGAAEEPVNRPKIIVAIDGHAGSGKSTMAAELAQAVGYAYIDTGAMYRAVTLYAVQNGMAGGNDLNNLNEEALTGCLDNICIEFRINAATGRSEVWLNGRCVEREIRSMDVTQWVSRVAAVAPVRKKLVAMQQELGRNKGVVMDGRDIGAVVFPGAELKVFVTAAPEIRAKRRFDELEAKGEKPELGEILKNVKHRDAADETRKESPLRRTADALLLDNSFMTRGEQQAWLLDHFYKAASHERV